MEESVHFKPTGGGSFNPLSMYPIGSIYRSVKSTDPSELFGGTWELLKDVFLMAAGDKYAAGSTGGEAQHKLTVAETPQHRHSSSSYQVGYPVNTTGNNDYCTWVNGGAVNNNEPTTGENGAVRTSWVGDGQPHNNLPPYLAVYTWVRVA